jgi:anaerobic ribonucleoside-triphosphate reductase activating protein
MMQQSVTNIKVSGLTPLTTIDYPDHLSCVVYTQGCSWRCRYCHNPDLVYATKESNKSWQEILAFLKKRQGLLEAVVFCGGEPLLQKNLLDSMQQVKKLGFKIGLHTAGSIPKRFEQVLSIVDWVGFDVKDLPEYVDDITQVEGSGVSNWQSLKWLLDSGLHNHGRTTVHWQLHTPDRLIQLTQKLVNDGVESYSIQFSRTENMLDKQLGYSVLPTEIMLGLKSELKKIMPTIKFSDN